MFKDPKMVPLEGSSQQFPPLFHLVKNEVHKLLQILGNVVQCYVMLCSWWCPSYAPPNWMYLRVAPLHPPTHLEPSKKGRISEEEGSEIGGDLPFPPWPLLTTIITFPRHYITWKGAPLPLHWATRAGSRGRRMYLVPGSLNLNSSVARSSRRGSVIWESEFP